MEKTHSHQITGTHVEALAVFLETECLAALAAFGGAGLALQEGRGIPSLVHLVVCGWSRQKKSSLLHITENTHHK